MRTEIEYDVVEERKQSRVSISVLYSLGNSFG